MTRRELAAGVLAAAAGAAQDRPAPAKPRTMNMGGLIHTMPEQPERIAMLAYPGMTALDLVGPQQVFGMMGAQAVLTWKTREPIVTDSGLTLVPGWTFADCPEPLDMLFVPGGGGPTVRLMSDPAVLSFLAKQGRSARWVASVCSGSLILGAAGLLKGYRATSHWSVREVLADLGATPVAERVVEDRNRITAGGVTSGIDFGLRIAAKLRGEDFARALELNLEYDPQPPFASGTPAKAGERIAGPVRKMYAPLVAAAKTAAAERKESL
jgi:cyclohexyl-isocyanide hydratase